MVDLGIKFNEASKFCNHQQHLLDYVCEPAAQSPLSWAQLSPSAGCGSLPVLCSTTCMYFRE